VADFGSCRGKGSCLDSGRFCDDVRLWPSHLPRVTEIISSLDHRSVPQSSDGCPLSRVGHVGVEGGAKNPGESRQVITAMEAHRLDIAERHQDQRAMEMQQYRHDECVRFVRESEAAVAS
jgi:hypothetical protein